MEKSRADVDWNTGSFAFRAVPLPPELIPVVSRLTGRLTHPHIYNLLMTFFHSLSIRTPVMKDTVVEIKIIATLTNYNSFNSMTKLFIVLQIRICITFCPSIFFLVNLNVSFCALQVNCKEPNASSEMNMSLSPFFYF